MPSGQGIQAGSQDFILPSESEDDEDDAAAEIPIFFGESDLTNPATLLMALQKVGARFHLTPEGRWGIWVPRGARRFLGTDEFKRALRTHERGIIAILKRRKNV